MELSICLDLWREIGGAKFRLSHAAEGLLELSWLDDECNRVSIHFKDMEQLQMLHDMIGSMIDGVSVMSI